MEGCTDGGENTRAYRSQMIGVDLLAECNLARRAVEKGADAGDGFGEGDRGAAMEVAPGVGGGAA